MKCRREWNPQKSIPKNTNKSEKRRKFSEKDVESARKRHPIFKKEYVINEEGKITAH
jgi:hypothetical protein